ncbi:hypothetical protein IQE94_10240 [Synechocystis sp. PCC 7339]|uniref:hypothetical protein n=1 Tax=unclassified Synechocystis TaxID=2640012 RepID=UPI001BAEFEAF|nr:MULTISPECIES: hypothetical protein [unclassified Synechocystis]QUS59351.1 hypothetical protein HTZ78_00725 [Synechocystis sp. PCC 7338]UAJ71537.1 hypothetical protein IQE94_10240 [Synechocystis sp. PCC 7339]
MTPPQPSGRKRLGLVLQEASLITPAQLEVAVNNQQHFDYLIGEVIVLHGWLSRDTVEFFVNQWFDLICRPNPMPLGHYLQMADLLNQCQIDQILREQKVLGLRFGATAVLLGLLKQETVDYFIAHLKTDMASQSAFSAHELAKGSAARARPIKTTRAELKRQKHRRPAKETPRKGSEEKKHRRVKTAKGNSLKETPAEVSGSLPENFDIFINDDENFDLANVLEMDDGNVSL